MLGNDDQLALLDDLSAPESASGEEICWYLLIVDDDEDVHHATEYALSDLRVLGRPLKFLHAFSASEAIGILAHRRDVAVILLDVVMEREDAGLKAVEAIRHDLGLDAVRIVLRTGQPGYAPELDAITNYDINDYKTKSELTRSKLFTTVTAAIRSFDQIQRLEASRSGLEMIIRGSSQFSAEQGLASFASAVIKQLADLLEIPSNGMVSVCAEGDADAGVILAAAGRYDSYAGQPLLAVADIAARTMLEACLLKRQNLDSDCSMALYFAGRHGRNFAVYVESTAAIRQLDRHLLDVFRTNISMCIENIGLVERLRTAAYVDELTRLPNRAAQIASMDECLTRDGSADQVLALVDIDQFSETIDAFGYRFGDQQLRAVAGRLRNMLPDDLLVARVGSDVFGIFGRGENVNPENLRSILLKPFDSEGGLHTISFSIGLVRADAAHADGADLLRNGAIALKHAKLAGPGNDAYYTAEVGRLTRQRIHMLHDLRTALEMRDLFVVYQPQIDLANGQVVGIEALLRWRNAKGEFVPLEQFIAVAEQSGLIVEVGAWVLNTALAAQHEFGALGYSLRLAVNVSPVQFRQADFLEMVRDAIARNAADPGLLELEITESVALSGWSQIVERMQALKALGVLIAIDDFGTGFSSLAYLARLPADCLKIDRCFVSALGDQHSGTPIAAMVVQLGKQLGMRVLAEGVEDSRQLQTLIELGCCEAQGRVYAPPMTQAELLLWLRARGR